MALIFNDESWQLVKTGGTVGEWCTTMPTEAELMSLAKNELLVLMKRGGVTIENARGASKKMEDATKEELTCALMANWSQVYKDARPDDNSEPQATSITSTLKSLTKVQLLALADVLMVKTVITADGKKVKQSIKTLNESLIAAIMATNSEHIIKEWLQSKAEDDDKDKSKGSSSK